MNEEPRRYLEVKQIDGVTVINFIDSVLVDENDPNIPSKIQAIGEQLFALVDGQGQLKVFENQRGGHFQLWPLPAGVGKVLAVSAADANHDGSLDLVILEPGGAIRRLSRNASGEGWDTGDVARWAQAPADGSARLFWADLDDNGALDLVASGSGGTQVWLADKSAETLAKLQALGFEVVLDPKTAKLVIGRLPIEKLEALAELKAVRYVAPQISN